MKKKMIAAAVLSTVLIGGTAVSIYANSGGYELYKDALKNTHTLDSARTNMEATVTDNGKEINKVEMNTAYNLQQNMVQGNVSFEGNNYSENLDIAYQEKRFFIKNAQSETYYVMKDEKSDAEKKESFEKHHNPEIMKIMEHAFDALTVQVHDDFKVSEDKNGQTTISVDLTNKDIPTLFREIGEYMVKRGTEAHENVTMSPTEYPFVTGEITSDVPVLVENIKIEAVKLNAQLTKDQIIQKQTMMFSVSGEDRDGIAHKIEFKIKVEFSNMNNQKLDELTIDENQTKQIELTQMKGAHHF